jgi:hypothetical protein
MRVNGGNNRIDLVGERMCLVAGAECAGPQIFRGDDLAARLALRQLDKIGMREKIFQRMRGAAELIRDGRIGAKAAGRRGGGIWLVFRERGDGVLANAISRNFRYA